MFVQYEKKTKPNSKRIKTNRVGYIFLVIDFRRILIVISQTQKSTHGVKF